MVFKSTYLLLVICLFATIINGRRQTFNAQTFNVKGIIRGNSQIDKVSKEIQALEKVVEKLKTSSNSRSMKNSDAMSKLTEEVDEISVEQSSQISHNMVNDKQIDRLKHNLNAANNRMDTSSGKLVSMEQRLESQEKQTLLLNNRGNDTYRKVKATSGQLSKIKQRLNSQEKETLDLKINEKETDELTKASAGKLNNFEQRLTSQEKQTQDLKIVDKEADGRMKTSSSKLKGMEVLLKSQKMQIQVLQTGEKSAERQIDASSGKLDSLEKRLKSQEKETQYLKIGEKEADVRMETSSGKLDNIEQRLKSQEKQTKNLKISDKATDSRIKMSSNKVNNIERRMKSQENQIVVLKNGEKSAKSQMKASTGKISKVEQHVNSQGSTLHNIIQRVIKLETKNKASTVTKKTTTTKSKTTTSKVKSCATSALRNLASNKPTTQSSTYRDGSSKSNNAVDNKHGTAWYKGDCSSTGVSRTHAEWWQVDLQRTFAVYRLDITPRDDLFGTSNGDLGNFKIEVFAKNPKTSKGTLCYQTKSALRRGSSNRIACTKPVEGRYVRITKQPSKHGLTICTVAVWAC